MGSTAVAVPFDIEGRGFVGPLDLVEVEEFRELPFAVMGEFDALVGKKPARQMLSSVCGLDDLLALPCPRSWCGRSRTTISFTVLHGALCGPEFAQRAGKLVADLVDRDDRAENTLAAAE